MDYGIFNVRIDVNACGCTRGCTDTCKRVCTESRLWEKNPLPHRGIEPALVACRSYALPTELHPHPLRLSSVISLVLPRAAVFLFLYLWHYHAERPSPDSVLSTSTWNGLPLTLVLSTSTWNSLPPTLSRVLPPGTAYL